MAINEEFLDTRFVADINQPNVELLEADVRHLSLELDAFDLIHARMSSFTCQTTRSR